MTELLGRRKRRTPTTTKTEGHRTSTLPEDGGGGQEVGADHRTPDVRRIHEWKQISKRDKKGLILTILVLKVFFLCETAVCGFFCLERWDLVSPVHPTRQAGRYTKTAKMPYAHLFQKPLFIHDVWHWAKKRPSKVCSTFWRELRVFNLHVWISEAHGYYDKVCIVMYVISM